MAKKRERERTSASCAREDGTGPAKREWGRGGKVTEEKPKEESGATHEGGSCTRERGKEREATSTREGEGESERERKRVRGEKEKEEGREDDGLTGERASALRRKRHTHRLLEDGGRG